MHRISLLSSLSRQNQSLAICFLLLTGCTELSSTPAVDAAPYYNAPPEQTDFDELLAFGANMAKIQVSSRAEVCHTLLKRQKAPPGIGIYLHLMMGRLLSDACGDIPKILDGVATISPDNLSDERLQKLIAIHTEALKRLQNVAKKSGSQERKQKSSQSAQEAKESTDAPGAKKNETRLLREKLDAIRSMEKHLDESGDAK